MNIITLPYIGPKPSKGYYPYGVYVRTGNVLSSVGHRTKKLEVAQRRAKVLQRNYPEVEIRKMNKVIERLVNEELEPKTETETNNPFKD